MFDTMLGAAGTRREVRRTLATLPAALAVHGAALGAVVVGQLWAVEPVRQPDAVAVFVEVIPPPPAAPRTNDGGRTTRVAPPVPGHQPSSPPTQPRVIPPDLPSAPPSEPPGEPGVEGGDDRATGPDVEVARPVREPPPPVAVPADVPLRPGAGIVLPVSVERRDPVYPELARKAHLEGIVIVEATIDRHGNVVDARVLRDPGLGCGAAVVEAMRDWRYRPATLNGRPVSIIVTVTVNFRLGGSA